MIINISIPWKKSSRQDHDNWVHECNAYQGEDDILGRVEVLPEDRCESHHHYHFEVVDCESHGSRFVFVILRKNAIEFMQHW